MAISRWTKTIDTPKTYQHDDHDQIVVRVELESRGRGEKDDEWIGRLYYDGEAVGEVAREPNQRQIHAETTRWMRLNFSITPADLEEHLSDSDQGTTTRPEQDGGTAV